MKPGETEEFDAIVVGCGPVGAVAALHLSRAGRRVAVVEEHPHVYPYPRAVMLDGYSCSILAELLAEDFDRVLLEPTPGAGYYLDKDALDKPFAVTELQVGDRRSWMFQPQLERVLRDKIAAQPNIETFLGWTARKLYADADAHLTIEETATGTMRSLTGRYLLGCDGGGSFVRKQAGGSLQSLGDTVLFLIVDATVSHEHLAGERGFAYQIVDQQRPTTYLPMGVNDHCRWEFRINPDDDILALQSPERILELISPWADVDHVDLLRHTVYKFNSLIANEWRFGNVFLCGDAAHQTSPFLGQGLNMGIRNTRNLCQKIDLVASGLAADALLDRYQTECFDDTKGTIKEALKMGKVLFNTSPAANRLRSTVAQARRGKPIDITAQVAPVTRALDIDGHAPPDVRKVLPRLEATLADGTETMLMLVEPNRPKIVTTRALPADLQSWVDALPAVIRPLVYVHDDDLTLPDAKSRARFFGDDDYVVLLENSVLLGRYSVGAEHLLKAYYNRAFCLA